MLFSRLFIFVEITTNNNVEQQIPIDNTHKSLIQDSKIKIQAFLSLLSKYFVLLVVICCYQLVFVVISCYPLLFVVISWYLLLFVVISWYLLLSVVICCYPLLFVVISTIISTQRLQPKDDKWPGNSWHVKLSQDSYHYFFIPFFFCKI